jgi:hypothetical protein
MRPAQLFSKISDGHVTNVAFADLQGLVKATGFALSHVKGSYHIFIHPDVPEQLNLQPWKGEAKPYQIRQFLVLVRKYRLTPDRK